MCDMHVSAIVLWKYHNSHIELKKHSFLIEFIGLMELNEWSQESSAKQKRDV